MVCFVDSTDYLLPFYSSCSCSKTLNILVFYRRYRPETLHTMKGRRVALLLTGLLPLMAEHDIPKDNDRVDHGDTLAQFPFHSAEPIHDDALRVLPALPIEFKSSVATGSVTNHTVVAMELAQIVDLMEQSTLPPLVVEERTATKNNGSDDNSLRSQEHTALLKKQENNSSEINKENSKTNETVMSSSSMIDPTSTNQHIQPYPQLGLQEHKGRENDTSGDLDENITSPNLTVNKDEREGKSSEDDDGPIERVLVDYASKSAGALILEKSPSMKGTSNLLNGDKDKYAIAPCNDKKFVVVGLSEDILVKQVKLANYERYSSHVHTFQILGSQTMGDWLDLGTYEAHAGNGEQAFDLLDPSWARYLKFRFLSHFGTEHYCTVSQIKVHGSTMLQGFHEQWNDGEEDNGVVENRQEEDIQLVNITHGNSTDGDSSKESYKEVKIQNIAIVSPSETRSLDTISESEEPPYQESSNGTSHTTVDAKIENGSPPNVDTDKQGSRMDEEMLTWIDDDLKEGLVKDIHAFDPEETPSTLKYASINRPASKSIKASGIHELAQLDANAVTGLTAVNDAVKAFVVETSEAIINAAKEAPDAIEKIQQKIKATIEAVLDKDSSNYSEIFTVNEKSEVQNLEPKPGETGAIIESKIAANELEGNPEFQVEGSPLPVIAGTENTDREVKIEPDKVPRTNSSAKSVLNEQLSKNVSAAELDVAEISIQQIDESQHDIYMVPEGLMVALGRFPSAKCLQNLNYPDLLASKASAKAAVANGHQQGTNARMEPIFKTLTDEIRLLQVSQSVQDQFSKDLVSCYQSIILDMVTEFDRLQSGLEARLLRLEVDMQSMKYNGLRAMLVSALNAARVFLTYAISRISVVGSLLSDLLELIVSISHQGYEAMLRLLRNEDMQRFVERLLSKEPEAVLIVAGSAAALTIFFTAIAKLLMLGAMSLGRYGCAEFTDNLSYISCRNREGKEDYHTSIDKAILVHCDSNISTPDLIETKQTKTISKRQAKLVPAE